MLRYFTYCCSTLLLLLGHFSLQAQCTEATINSVTAGPCAGTTNTATLIIDGDLGDAGYWAVYEGTCDSSDPIGPITSTTNEIEVPIADLDDRDITFFVSAEGGCVDPLALCEEFTFAQLFEPTFMAPDFVCVNAGVQTGLMGADPTGGTFSGAGVTDNGNGMSYSFDPATAGVGRHPISYVDECGFEASDTIEVTPQPTVTLADLTPIDVNDYMVGTGPTGLGMPDPTGGTYSSSTAGLVIDDGNGMTFSINPSQLMAGTYMITYTFTDSGGCTEQDTKMLEVTELATTFSPPAVVCLDAGVQAGLGGGTPAGGVYSGPGVTDRGDGVGYGFDPMAAGIGMHTITYTRASGVSASGTIIVSSPMVTFTAGLSGLTVASASQTLSGGIPAGGTYSGMGVVDNGDGTFNFDPATAGVGTFTITYTFTDENGCAGTATDMVTVAAEALPADECMDASDISSLFGQPFQEAQTSMVWDNTNYTTSMMDPSTGFDCFGEPGDGTTIAPSLERTIWYSFTGDGNMYRIRTVQCSASDDEYASDTQIAIYSGSCDDLTTVACGEDEDFDANLFNADVSIDTEEGVTYLVMIDGFGPDFPVVGQYCVEVTNISPNNVTYIDQTAINLYPNPTSGWLQIADGEVEQVEVFDAKGQLLLTQPMIAPRLDMTALPAGLYLLRLHTPDGVVSAKVVKE